MPKSDRCSLPWSREFDDPIPLPGGRELVTLRDAAHYITGLPKAEHDAPEWQDVKPDRPEAIRRLVEFGLKAKGKRV
jgi:hypothetical protein